MRALDIPQTCRSVLGIFYRNDEERLLDYGRSRTSPKVGQSRFKMRGLGPVLPEFAQRADLPASALAKDINDMAQPPGALQPVLLQAELDSIRIALLNSFKDVFVLFD